MRIKDIELSLKAYEIYKQDVFDLNPLEKFDPKKRQKMKIITIKENSIITDLNEEKDIPDTQHLDQVLTKLQQNRAKAETVDNMHSSRSHAVYQFDIKLEYCYKNGGLMLVPFKKNVTVCLIDLAGAERNPGIQQKIKGGGRKSEGIEINQSLVVLGRCLRAMRKNKQEKLPVMESTLTKILIKYLNNRHNVVMLTNIRQTKINQSQEVCVLEYASSSNCIRLRKPQMVSIDPVPFKQEVVDQIWQKTAKDIQANLDSIEFQLNLEKKKYQLQEDVEQLCSEDLGNDLIIKMLKDQKIKEIDEHKEFIVDQMGIKGFFELKAHVDMIDSKAILDGTLDSLFSAN